MHGIPMLWIILFIYITQIWESYALLKHVLNEPIY